MRCQSLRKTSVKYPEAKWFIWVDSVETHIDLTNNNILYHLFHGAPWGCYPINTGVKIVNRDSLVIEDYVWTLRNTTPWNTFPYEQKTIYEFVLPRIKGKYIIHDHI